MALKLTILGSNSAIPTASRFPTSQLVDVNQSYYLVDCGEGAQMQLRKYRIKMQRIKAIFISHMHGDHYFGLIGLLNTMHLLGRETELTVYGPDSLEPIMRSMLNEAETKLRYSLTFVSITGKTGEIYEDNTVSVKTFPLNHRIPCNGFRFDELPKKRRIKKSVIDLYHVPVEQMPKLKDGSDLVLENGEVIPNEKLTEPPKKSFSFAFCSDTCYDERIIPYIQHVDLLYHEATFLNDMKPRAKQTFHSTAEEAAIIAQKAETKRLLIGHFSARYTDLEGHLIESRAVFKNTDLAIEGEVFSA